MSPPLGGPDLFAVYLEQRDALGRFFRARLGPQADVEDLVQELYLKLQAAPDIEVREPRAYLYRLASNLMMDRWRSGMRSAARDGAWATLHQGEVDEAPSAEAVVAGRQGLAAVSAVLADLPEGTQTVFRMHKFEALSYAEVASRLGVSRSTVEKRMMQALKALATRRDHEGA
ncbi:RNA polymerase sigma factor [Brevundimonas diminuta]|uniref:RNA polymerase sigma factor n=1 Tax=Brevundimonas diminuta TaxID=293 RepID=UPI003D07C53F